MLRKSVLRTPLALAALGGFALFAAGCAHPVSLRPNVEVGRTIGQAIVVENLTSGTLTFLPAQGSSETNLLVLQPGGHASLAFTLSHQTNQARAGESEFVLVATNTSSYVGQRDTDLIIRARFGASTLPRELRILPGPCLFETNAANAQHPLSVGNPPQHLKQLCP